MEIPFRQGALVVTSISGPNPVLESLAESCRAQGARFIVIGDRKSPAGFHLAGCEFHGLESQSKLPFAYARACPERSYARKNIGYLLAIQGGAQFIVETDDDNFPKKDFWMARNAVTEGTLVSGEGWCNAYHYFSDVFIYPRGFPIDLVRGPAVISPKRQPVQRLACPIQQGLADENPDVDAIYRMLYPLPVCFRDEMALVLDCKLWCPFNSQNTTTFPEAYPLLYLPAHCSFRMTDIWRGFIAQRILWTCGWRLSFHSASVRQDRNDHSLIRDFEDEVPGYLHNSRIVAALTNLRLKEGPETIPENMRICYEALVKLGMVDAKELALLDLWLDDLRSHISSSVSE